jgi:hypothetical protein
MTFAELTERVDREGYGHLLFERGPSLLAIYDFRIELCRSGSGQWRVCDTERGQILNIHLETFDEAAACALWYERVCGMGLLLCKWPTADLAEQAEVALTNAGIASHRNDLPEDPAFRGIRFRNFVAGRDLLRGAEVLSALD